jgi:hypothetical protein
MNSGLDRDFNFGADPIIGGDQERITKARRLEIENAAEAADFGVGTTPPCGAHNRLDFSNHRIARIDIDAGTGIGEAFPICHIAPGASPPMPEFFPVSTDKKRRNA